MTGTIYVLRHPDDMTIVYVGKTIVALDKRLGGHLSSARSVCGKYPLKAWLRSLMALGRRPLIEPFIRGVPLAELGKFEALAFRSLNKSGLSLLNSAPIV